MFAVLKFEESDTSFKGRMRDFFFAPEINIEQISYKDIASFMIITAKKRKGKIPWSEIQKLCLKLKVRLILPKGILLPENSQIKQYKNSGYELKLLFYRMLHTVEIIKPDPVRESLCIIDKKGILCDEIIKAVPFFSKINIITENRNSYSKQSEKILDMYGLSITFINEVCYTNENAFIVCKNGNDVPLFFKGTAFCNTDVHSFDCNVIRYTHEDIPENMRKIIPCWVEQVDFLSAVAEMSTEKG